MRDKSGRSGSPLGPLALAAFALGWLATGRAEAQFGFGGYGGYGFGFYHSRSVDFLNQQALQNGARATMGPVERNVYAGNPNAYVNHLHDDGFLDKYDPSTRRALDAQVSRYSDGPPPWYHPEEHAPAPSRSASGPVGGGGGMTQPVLPLSSFFDRYQKLVWPRESPATGELGARREAANLACLAVLNEYNLKGLAQLGTVADARAKVVAYGRPALQYVRDNETPRVADTFHLFELSLYEGLAQAATVPKPAAPSPAASTPSPEPPPTPARP